MSKVVNQRSGTNTLSNFFDKVNTAGDAHRFLGSETGAQEVQAFTLAVAEDIPVTLGFNYLVGVKQLRVYQQLTINAVSFWSPVLLEGLNPTATVEYTETSGTEITLTGAGLGIGTHTFLFDVPHTSIPAELREKILVRDQGKNDAIELLGNGDGLLMRSGSGYRYLLRLDDSGNPVTEPR